MKISILPPVRFDIIEGYWFYERQRDGLGEYFVKSITQDIDSLSIYAGVHVKVRGKHRMVCRRFPFSIFYLKNESGVRVFAILDNRRNPEYITERLN